MPHCRGIAALVPLMLALSGCGGDANYSSQLPRAAPLPSVTASVAGSQTPAPAALPQACDIVTRADAEAVLDRKMRHPGRTKAERASSSSATVCAWAPPGTPYAFSGVRAVAVLVHRDPKAVAQLEKDPMTAMFERADVLGLPAYLVSDDKHNTGSVVIVYDAETFIQISVAVKAPTARENAGLALSLARQVLGP